MSRPDLHIDTGHEDEELHSSQDEYSDEGESVSLMSSSALSTEQPRAVLQAEPHLRPPLTPTYRTCRT